MSLDEMEQDLREMLGRECLDPERVDVDSIITMVVEEIAATKQNT